MKEGDKICIIQGADAQENLALVAALTALGVPFYAEQPYLETREIVHGEERITVTWCMKTSTADGRFKTQELIRWWHDEAWLAANEDHPLAYARAAAVNYRRIADGVKGSAPVGIVRKGSKFALIPFDVSPERRKELLDSLEKAS